MKLKNWMLAAVITAVAAVAYFTTMANFAFPGESAHLQTLWHGLDTVAVRPYPLLEFFAGIFGGGNAIAPVCGVVSVLLVFLLTSEFVRFRIGGEEVKSYAAGAANIAGLVAAFIFMLSPAVWGAATHLEPRLFDFTWALLAFALVKPWMSTRNDTVSLCFPLAIGVMWGLGMTDGPIFFAAIPFILFALTMAPLMCGRKPYLGILIFLVALIVSFCWFGTVATGDLGETLSTVWGMFKQYTNLQGWLFIALFSTMPFVVAIFSSFKAFNEKGGFVSWTFHIAMSIVSILAVATPLAPGSLMEIYGILPVAPTAFASITAGYLAAYWWLQIRADNGAGRILGYCLGGILAFVYLFAFVLDFFAFDSKQGAFADKMAGKIIDDLGDRSWFVTDGTLDNHLRLVAEKRGRELNLVCLSRDLDKSYLEQLSKLVKEKQLGGDKCDDLSLSLSLGVLPFVQDWFTVDSAAVKNVAIFGASDLWYSSGLKPVPEFAFFGADPDRKVNDGDWKEFDEVLSAPKGWGSYRIHKNRNPIDRMRLNLRRHLGLVANNRGVYLQDEGKLDEAFAIYERVLTEIDTDNICSLFNLFEMSRAKHPKASAKKFEYEKRIKGIVADADRRYRLWTLSNYYGYIRSPDIFLRLGFTWARSGRPGDALSQIRRAIDFIPTDRRSSILNMMAALYANEDDRIKSRKTYEEVLSKNADDHDALIGLMRLELLDGNSAEALAYLERATKAGGDDPRIKVELAMLALMKNDLPKAKDILKKVTDADAANLQAWSLLAAVTMQQCDLEKDAKAKNALAKELEDSILPTMEKQARSPYDYYVQTTRAFVLLRQGEAKRKAARDAFVTAAKARPDIAATADLVLGLDISLNDVEGAAAHARDVLRRNRKAPLANYVMGSLALQKGDYRGAEAYLRRSADARKPVALAMNDLAEVLRRTDRLEEAERYARKAVKEAPKLYVAWETLGSILMDGKRNLDEAEDCVQKACEMSKDKDGKEGDIRMVISLARVQSMRGDRQRCNATLRRVQPRLSELSEFEKKEYQDLVKKNAR